VLSVGLSGNGVPSFWYTMEAENPSQAFQVVAIDCIPTGQVVESGFARSFLGIAFRSLYQRLL